MKWGIILLAVILILGTMLDLYFSLAIRTFYLTMLHYPDIMDLGEDSKSPKKNKTALAKRAYKYQTPSNKLDHNVT